MNLIQLKFPNNLTAVGVLEGNKIINLTAKNKEIDTTYKLFMEIIKNSITIEEFLEQKIKNCPVFEFNYEELISDPKKFDVNILPPITHPDPYRLFISGTGLTHTGSVKSRDMMHNDDDEKKDQTDSAKMFEMGLKGGKPSSGEIGVAPEWFYKGNGFNIKGHKDNILLPSFSLDGGEEPEVVGCYIIDEKRNPVRIGFSLGNEFSDHETEQINYLYLAHSKLRNCSVGPSINTSLNFSDVTIKCDINRDGSVIYSSGELKSGEEYMSHSLNNMEYHHFKYDIHRNPGDIHLHFFGTSQLSFSTRKWKFKPGDSISIYSDQFQGMLENTVEKSSEENFEIKKV